MIKYYIRTTNERIIDKSYEQIDYTKLIDLSHKPIESFIEQLKVISDVDSVLLEDDLILCRGFKKEIEKVIKEYPNYIINFFTRPTIYFTTNTNNQFGCNQCTYYPKGIARVVAEEMERVRITFPTMKQYDTIEDIALKRLGIVHVDYRPCLVQHINKNSLIQLKALNNMRTYYFKDYLDELGINYDDSKAVFNHINKLIDKVSD